MIFNLIFQKIIRNLELCVGYWKCDIPQLVGVNKLKKLLVIIDTTQ